MSQLLLFLFGKLGSKQNRRVLKMRYRDLFVAILVVVAIFTANNVDALEFSDTFFLVIV